jgi:hypothetical protein
LDIYNIDNKLNLPLHFRFKTFIKGRLPMTQEGFKRKLTAILSADVVGYSRLMGEDEDTTVQTLRVTIFWLNLSAW